MSIVTVLIVLVVAGVCLYLINQYLPMARPFKIAVNVIAVLALIVWLLSAFGLVRMPAFGTVRGHSHAEGCR